MDKTIKRVGGGVWGGGKDAGEERRSRMEGKKSMKGEG